MESAYPDSAWPTRRADKERLVCFKCGSPRLVEVSTGWKRMAATCYVDGPKDYDVGEEVISDATECWVQCGDCNEMLWNGSESPVPESQWESP